MTAHPWAGKESQGRGDVKRVRQKQCVLYARKQAKNRIDPLAASWSVGHEVSQQLKLKFDVNLFNLRFVTFKFWVRTENTWASACFWNTNTWWNLWTYSVSYRTNPTSFILSFMIKLHTLIAYSSIARRNGCDFWQTEYDWYPIYHDQDACKRATVQIWF